MASKKKIPMSCDDDKDCDESVKSFKFDLGDKVKMTMSREDGVVVGRAEYIYASDSYLVRYVDGTGCQVECWKEVGAIELVKTKTR